MSNAHHSCGSEAGLGGGQARRNGLAKGLIRGCRVILGVLQFPGRRAKIDPLFELNPKLEAEKVLLINK